MASFRLALFVAAALIPHYAVAQLRPYYYRSICPNLDLIIRNSVKQSMAQSPISAPATLRLFFHDCAVQGCDASIMIMNSNGDDEQHNPDNLSLKPQGFNTILSAKAAVDSDPQCKYKLGRYDGKVSTKASVVLPHANFTLDQLNAYFSGLGVGGFTQSEMIALSGGHTLGAADCPFFQYRIGTDPTMDPNFAAQLKSTCSSNPSGFAFLDPSPVTFNNDYFKSLQGGKGLLGSDQVLFSDMRSRGTVNYYATNQGAFFGDFMAAMTKLGRVGVKTAANGEIRRDCRFPN
nr:unnamed protein product [Digitaria exilis]